MIHPRIAERLFNTPLLAHPGKAAAIVMGLGGRITGAKTEIHGADALHHVAFGRGRPSMGTLGARLDRQSGVQPIYDMVGSVAVIPVEGTLVHKGAWLESDSGETSYQGIQTQVQRAMRDPAVKGVVFEVDSFGGEVSGAFETAGMIAQLSAQKPTLSILTDWACSAGYMLASAARQVVVPETGGCGSIGVIAMHTDMSAALEQAGIRVTILKAGARKADFNPVEPLPEDVAAAYLAEIEQVRQRFCQMVADQRGGRISYEDAMATEADTYQGSAAVERGLADATGHPFEAFQAFTSMINRA
jgi:signal peptide peptidase SppA